MFEDTFEAGIRSKTCDEQLLRTAPVRGLDRRVELHWTQVTGGRRVIAGDRRNGEKDFSLCSNGRRSFSALAPGVTVNYAG